jgi:hypothetical protein
MTAFITATFYATMVTSTSVTSTSVTSTSVISTPVPNESRSATECVPVVAAPTPASVARWERAAGREFLANHGFVLSNVLVNDGVIDRG